MKSRTLILGLGFILCALMAFGCDTLTGGSAEVATTEPAGEAEEGGMVGMANPASVYCEEQGYTLEIRTGADGGEYGVCLFPDGTECEEWAYFRGECAPGAQPVEEPATGEAEGVQPSGGMCEELRSETAQILNVEVTLLADVPFSDPFDSSQTGPGCLITATGTGADFENAWTTADSLRAMFEANGWAEDPQYQADGPTGTASAFRRDNALAIMSVMWLPSDDANCPDDQPISACDIAPEQQLYTITLSLGELTSGAVTTGAETTSVTCEWASLSYDASLASGVTGEIVPAVTDAPEWAASPEHVECTFNGYILSNTFHEPRFYVYPIADFVAVAPSVETTVTNMEQLLAARPEILPGAGFTPPDIPFLPIFNAAQMVRAGGEYLDFQNGTGVRFLTQYGQAFYPINNTDLFYTFQGVTSDGYYYVAAILPVSNPILPADETEIPGGDFDAFANNFESYATDIAQQLEAQPAASFTPDLALLDAMIQSLVVNPAP
jgi:putative hemolysin